MPKPNRNHCKNGKQTNLLVQGARSAAQITLDKTKLSGNKNICIIDLSDINYLCLAKSVNLKENNQNI